MAYPGCAADVAVSTVSYKKDVHENLNPNTM